MILSKNEAISKRCLIPYDKRTPKHCVYNVYSTIFRKEPEKCFLLAYF